jgi:cell division transport system ATP-binding protein
MIHFDNVSKTYPDKTTALHGVTFRVEPGEFVSVVGHSGAGKTTLIKLLMAEESPSDGFVHVQEKNIAQMKKRQMLKLRQNIGVVFQDFKLLPHMNVFENIAFAMEAAGRLDADIKSDVPYVLELVDLHDKAERFPHQLSGGEQQRVAIARAIVNNPDLIIADEPTGNLDPLNTYDIVQILKKINELGTTVMLTTHNKGVIDSLNHRVITMDGGKIVRDDEHGKYII